MPRSLEKTTPFIRFIRQAKGTKNLFWSGSPSQLFMTGELQACSNIKPEPSTKCIDWSRRVGGVKGAYKYIIQYHIQSIHVRYLVRRNFSWHEGSFGWREVGQSWTIVYLLTSNSREITTSLYFHKSAILLKSNLLHVSCNRAISTWLIS